MLAGMAPEGPHLVFVYNVDGSPTAMLKDLVQGIRTGTTDCHLCDLTFGRLLKDRSWRRFVDGLPLPVDFQLRSTFRRRHPECADAPAPAAYLIADGGRGRPEQVLSAGQIEAVEDLDGLRTLVADTVARLV